MPKQYADMHIHSTFSDGTLSVKELCKRAKENGLKAIAISDHDYCESFDIIKKEADYYNLETFSAVEISSNYNGLDIHLLVYGLRLTKKLEAKLKKIRKSRFFRAKKIIKNLQNLFAINIQFEDVLKISSANIGRPHIAKALIKKKIVKNVKEAFALYLNSDNPAYISKYRLDIKDAITLSKESGGITSIAHFGRYTNWVMLDNLRDFGLDALEIYHPSHSLKLKAELEKYAKNNHLLKTGGSDFHGGKTFPHDIASQKVPYAYFADIQKIIT